MSDHRPERVTPGAGRHRSRASRVMVVVVLAGLATVVALLGGAVLLLGGRGSTLGEDPTPVEPLLPGAPAVTAPPPATPFTVAGVGYDVSYPQCRSALPSRAAFAIVGVNGGAPLLSNKCFAEQVAWARTTQGYAVYVNTAYTGAADPVAYGYKLIDDAIAREHAAGVRTAMWWLDVEVTNTWAGTTQQNATVLAAMASRLQGAGARVGIYSSPQQWAQIAGDWAPGLPVWNATGNGTQSTATKACAESFAGSSTAIVQWVQKSDGRLLDHNLICPSWSDRAGELLDISTG